MSLPIITNEPNTAKRNHRQQKQNQLRASLVQVCFLRYRAYLRELKNSSVRYHVFRRVSFSRIAGKLTLF